MRERPRWLSIVTSSIRRAKAIRRQRREMEHGQLFHRELARRPDGCQRVHAGVRRAGFVDLSRPCVDLAVAASTVRARYAACSSSLRRAVPSACGQFRGSRPRSCDAWNGGRRLGCRSAHSASHRRRRIRGVTLAFFVDGNPDLKQATLAGRPILPPEELRHFPDLPVLISSYRYEREIAARLRSDGYPNQPVLLYGQSGAELKV
jgi:hypothetical protein